MVLSHALSRLHIVGVVTKVFVQLGARGSVAVCKDLEGVIVASMVPKKVHAVACFPKVLAHTHTHTKAVERS